MISQFLLSTVSKIHLLQSPIRNIHLTDTSPSADVKKRMLLCYLSVLSVQFLSMYSIPTFLVH